MTCEIVHEVCKRAGERVSFDPIELVGALARRRLPNQPYALGVRARPNDRPATGFEYESSGGQSDGKAEPRWPMVLGATVLDGSITWTCVALSNASLIWRINGVTYTVPTGITLHEQTFVDEPGAQQIPIEVSGGAAGQTYDIIVRVQLTTAGASAPLDEIVVRVTVDE